MVTTSDTTPLPLLVIYAGGTIGMQASSRGLIPAGDMAPRLEAALATLPPLRRRALPAYTLWESPEPIDSSSATFADWSALAALIAAQHETYAGFVILHGTDTLAWCASALAFQLQGLTKPVVVTGSQRPLGQPDSDALDNLEASLAFAATPGWREVGLCFHGRLLRGCRARKWYTRDDTGFESPNWPLLGELVDGVAALYPARAWRDEGAPRFELPARDPAPQVVRVTLWPGIDASLVERWLDAAQVAGAVLECWGSGNLPDDPALIGVLARAAAEGKPLVALSQCPIGGAAPGTYASGQILNDIGVMSGDDMTVEAACSKLTHLLAQDLPQEELRRRFLTPLAGERGAFTSQVDCA